MLRALLALLLAAPLWAARNSSRPPGRALTPPSRPLPTAAPHESAVQPPASAIPQASDASAAVQAQPTALETGRALEASAGREESGSRTSAAYDGLKAPSAAVDAGELDGLEGRELFMALHQGMTTKHRPMPDYAHSQRALFGTVEQEVENGRPGVRSAYSLIFVPGSSDDGNDYPEPGDQNGDGFEDKDGMNVEHVWPQSFFSRRDPMRSDLHHLLPTYIHVNEIRGNLPFGVVRGRGDYSNRAGAKRGQGVFEPPDASKGRVARAMLYFYVRYHDKNITNGQFGPAFWNEKLPLLLEWNRRFPPSEHEKRRNGRVEALQGNRNPFIDDPSLADRVGIDALTDYPRPRGEIRGLRKKRRRDASRRSVPPLKP